MPQHRRYPRRRPKALPRRRIYKRKARWPRVTRTVTVSNRGPTSTPDVFFTKLKYSFNKTLSTSGAQIVGSQFVGNNLFDPDVALGGQQPMGFDQFKELYQNYIVFGCMADVTFLNQLTGANALCMLLWQAAQDGNAPAIPTDPEEARERAYVKKTYVNTANAGGAIKRIKSYMTTKKMFGLKRLDISNTAYIHYTDTGGLNLNQFYLQVLNAQVNADSTVVAAGTLTYYVRFFNRKPLLRS